MYDAIVQEAAELPAGVQMGDVVHDSDRADLQLAAAADSVTIEQVHFAPGQPKRFPSCIMRCSGCFHCKAVVFAWTCFIQASNRSKERAVSRVLRQVQALHRELRENCDTMGIGLGGDPRGRRDTVAEVDPAPAAAAAVAAGTGKDLGDVK